MTSTKSFAQRVAQSRWRSRREELMAAGQWNPFVPAGPVRAHVNRIRAAGMPVRALEDRLGMSAHHLDHLLWGSEGSGPSEKVRTETAQLLLGFWPRLDDFPDQSRVDPAGTRRRIEALAVRGFNLVAIAGRCGSPPRYFQKAMVSKKVTARLARAVRDVYGAWWDADPADHGVKDWVADRTRRAADRRGWYGPLAWDDDTIDDPNAVPQVDAPAPARTEGDNIAARWLMGESVVLGREDRRAVLAHLYEWTSDTTEQIAARLEMTPEAAERQWHRLQEKAKADGRRLWRRVYVRPDRQLRQNEMGEAA